MKHNLETIRQAYVELAHAFEDDSLEEKHLADLIKEIVWLRIELLELRESRKKEWKGNQNR